MRMRYRAVLYQVEDGEDLRQHYQQLVEEFMRQTNASRAMSRRAETWRPPTDIHETPEAFIVKIEVAGMDEEAIDVTLYHDAVVISGIRQDDSEREEGMSYHEAQIRYGPFQAPVFLPHAIDREGAEARYHNGFLRLRLPKKPPERLRVKPGKTVTTSNQAIATDESNPSSGDRETI